MAHLEPEPGMGGWTTEVRDESAFLHGPPDGARPDRPDPEHCVRVLLRDPAPSEDVLAGDVEWGLALRVPARDLDEIRAALDQLLRHPAYRAFAAHGPVGTGAWSTPTMEEGWVRVDGPFVAPETDRSPWAMARSVELAYEYLAELRQVLATVVV